MTIEIMKWNQYFECAISCHDFISWDDILNSPKKIDFKIACHVLKNLNIKIDPQFFLYKENILYIQTICLVCKKNL